MTFEEWWDEYSADRDWPWRIRGAAHEAWHIATEAERERCAEKCDEIAAHWREQAEGHDIPNDHGRRDGAEFCAVAIREADDAD